MVKKIILIFSTLLLLVGCGYKPSVQYAKEQVGQKVFVDVYVSIEDPKNAVIIKDEVSSLLVNKFGSQLVANKNQADTIFRIRLNGTSISVLQYDEQGFARLYRANVSITVEYETKSSGKIGAITVSGIDDFTVDGEGEISESKRFDAIRNASNRALSEFLSKLAVQSFKKEPKKEENK